MIRSAKQQRGNEPALPGRRTALGTAASSTQQHHPSTAGPLKMHEKLPWKYLQRAAICPVVAPARVTLNPLGSSAKTGPWPMASPPPGARKPCSWPAATPLPHHCQAGLPRC